MNVHQLLARRLEHVGRGALLVEHRPQSVDGGADTRQAIDSVHLAAMLLDVATTLDQHQRNVVRGVAQMFAQVTAEDALLVDTSAQCPQSLVAPSGRHGSVWHKCPQEAGQQSRRSAVSIGAKVLHVLLVLCLVRSEQISMSFVRSTRGIDQRGGRGHWRTIVEL